MGDPQDAGSRRSTEKRRAMLAAAEHLFVQQGYERTSVDAIAARAGVSKRTVYDHFGDKASVFRAALEEAGATLRTRLAAAIEEELADGRDLRAGLLAFARRVTEDAFRSSAYHRYLRLASAARELADADADAGPEGMFEQRIAELADRGALRAANPQRAAQHFVALTLWMTREAVEAGGHDDAAVDSALVDGVDAFLRAYPPTPAAAAEAPPG